MDLPSSDAWVILMLPALAILERITIGLRTARYEADSYEPEAQASESPEIMHSLALRACIKCAQSKRKALYQT